MILTSFFNLATAMLKILVLLPILIILAIIIAGIVIVVTMIFVVLIVYGGCALLVQNIYKVYNKFYERKMK